MYPFGTPPTPSSARHGTHELGLPWLRRVSVLIGFAPQWMSAQRYDEVTRGLEEAGEWRPDERSPETTDQRRGRSAACQVGTAQAPAAGPAARTGQAFVGERCTSLRIPLPQAKTRRQAKGRQQSKLPGRPVCSSRTAWGHRLACSPNPPWPAACPTVESRLHVLNGTCHRAVLGRPSVAPGDPHKRYGAGLEFWWSDRC